jgi:hypothetical protein
MCPSALSLNVCGTLDVSDSAHCAWLPSAMVLATAHMSTHCVLPTVPCTQVCGTLDLSPQVSRCR